MGQAWRAASFSGRIVALLGCGILLSASQITQGFGYDAVGPATMPGLIAFGLIVSGGLMVLEARNAAEEDNLAFGRIGPVLMISVALLATASAIRTVGWVPMAAIVFVAGARAFGNSRWALNTVVGLALGVTTLVLFNRGLGLNLPDGTLWRSLMQSWGQ